MPIVGLTKVKVNGIYDLAFKNATWDVSRPETTHATGGGLQIATGIPVPKGNMDEVIDKSPNGVDWQNLSEFSIEILDDVTNQTVFAAEGCEWTGIGGSAAQENANATQRIGWVGKQTTVLGRINAT